MRGALNVFESDSDTERWAKLRRRVDELLPGDLGEDVLPYLAHFLNLPLHGALAERVAYLEGEALQRQVIRAVAVFIEKLAQQRPTVLMFDDLHWADSASLALLERLLALPDRAALLIGLLYRPDRAHGCWALGQTAARNYPHRYTEIILKPLNVDAQEDQLLVRHLLAIESIPDALAQIISRAEGNPFYIEEIIRAAIEANAIVPRGGQWHIASDLNLQAVPDNLQGIIMARIDRLLDEARRALQLASVVGRTFRYLTLNWLSTAAALAHLDSDLTDLQRAELIREQARIPELEYGFAQAMFREVAYESLLVRDRRTYHRLVGEQLEGLYSASQRDDVYELLAHHYSLSDDHPKALSYLIKAGDKTRSAYANQEAVNFYRQAEALAEEYGDDADKAAIAEGLGDVAYHVGEYDEALVRFNHALRCRHDPQQLADLHRRIGAVCEKRGEYAQALDSVSLGTALLTPDHTQTVEMARLLTLQCRVHHQQGQFEEAIEAGESALAIVEDTAHYRETAQAHNELGNAYEGRSELEKAIANYERGLLILERIGDEHGASKIYNNLALIYYQSLPARSSEYMHHVLATMQRLGDTWGESTALQNLGIVAFAQGNYDQASLYYERSLKIKTHLGDNQGIADCHINLGEVYRTQSLLPEAIVHLEMALKIGSEINSDQTRAECHRQLAECYLEAGDLARALEACHETLNYAEISGDRTRAAVIYRIVGKVHQQQNNLTAALEDYAQSIEMLQALNQEFDLGMTLSDYAQALHQNGQTAEAFTRLDEALVIFDRLDLPAERSKVAALLRAVPLIVYNRGTPKRFILRRSKEAQRKCGLHVG